MINLVRVNAKDMYFQGMRMVRDYVSTPDSLYSAYSVSEYVDQSVTQ